MDTVLRHWIMLQLIPKYPRKIDVGALCDRMNDFDPEVKVSRRTVERDLVKLSCVFGLISDGYRPQGWSVAKYENLDLPPLRKKNSIRITSSPLAISTI